MEAVWVRTRALLRRGWPATIALTLLIGLGAGIAMATLSAGRRTVTAYDRLVAYADPAELVLTFCPPGVTEVDQDSILACFTYPALAEQDVIGRLPEVDAAGSGAFRGVSVAAPGAGDGPWSASAFVLRNHSMQSFDGRPIILEGRWHRPDRREVVVNERFAADSGLAPGDEVELTFWADEELGVTLPDGERYGGPTTTATVVGISRGMQDLAATTGSLALQSDERKVFAGPGVDQATPGAIGFGGVLVDGNVPEDELLAAIQGAFGDRPFSSTPAVGDDERAPVREAIQYEGRGVTVLGALLAAAALVISGQSIARQTRREAADVSTLRAMGFTRGQVWLTAVLRGAVIGAPAAALAVALAVALSPLGPVGVGRQAEPDPGVHADVAVLAVGALVVLLTAVASAWVPLRRARSDTARSAGGRAAAGPTVGWLPAPVGVGVRLGRSGGATGRLPTSTAVVGVALAATTLAAALGLTASLDALRSHPERFGAPWDLSFGGVMDGSVEAALDHIVGSPDVASAAALAGTDAVIGGDVAWVHAFTPVEGIDSRIHPPIVSGRAPASIDEIALGSVTMRELGLEEGDAVEVGPAISGAETSTLTIVGTAVINDVYEHSPGRGGVVAPEWIERWAPEVTPDPYVVSLVPGADGAALAAAIREDFSGTVTGPVAQTAVRNVGRIRGLPYLLAGFVGLLAAGAFAHALLLSVRRSHAHLAVLRALGFTRNQVGTSVAVHATALAALATLIGLPLGVVAGRLGWRVIAEQLGVMTVEVTPLWTVAAVGVGVLLLANVVATIPAWRARRLRVASTLRTE